MSYYLKNTPTKYKRHLLSSEKFESLSSIAAVTYFLYIQ